MAFTTLGTVAPGDVLRANSGTAAYNNVIGNVKDIRAAQINVQQTFVTAATATTTSSGFADISGLSVNITPAFNDSKVLVIVHLNVGISTGQNTYYRLLRDSTVIGGGVAEGSRIGVMRQLFLNNNGLLDPIAHHFLDDPTTTNATTYKVQWAVSGGATLYLNRTGADTNASTTGRGASVITVQEIPV